jgi:hypothetical protein
LKKYSQIEKIFTDWRYTVDRDIVDVVYALSANKNAIINFNHSKQSSFRCFLLHECRVDCIVKSLQLNYGYLII